MVENLVSNAIDATRRRIVDERVASLDEVRQRGELLIGFSDDVAAESKILKAYLHQHLYQHHRIERMKDKARRVLEALFERYLENPRLIPGHTLRGSSDDPIERTIADYIAGMTDRYATEEYQRLFDPTVRV